MYCTKCGKPIESGNICNECAANAQTPNTQPAAPVYTQPAPSYQQPVYQQPVYQQPVYQQPAVASSGIPEPNNTMYGFGKALTSAILSVLAFIFIMYSRNNIFYSPVMAILLFFAAIPLSIIGIIFGISGIKTFTSRKDAPAKPIPALILGISGLSFGAISALFCFITLFVIFSALSYIF